MSINLQEVKGQGQNCHTEYLPLAISRLWFKIFTRFGNLTEVISELNLLFDKTQDGGLTVVCTRLSAYTTTVSTAFIFLFFVWPTFP